MNAVFRRLLPAALVVLSWMTPSLCAQTFVNGGTGTTGGKDCNITLSVTAGNKVVAVLTSTSVPTTLSISDGNSNTYSVAVGPFTDSGNNTTTETWTATIGTTNASLVIDMHTSSSVNNAACVVAQYSGLAASPVDKTATASNISVTTGITTGTTATTTQASELVVGAFGLKRSGTPSYTAGSGYTLREFAQGVGVDAVIEDKNVSSTGAYVATVDNTISSSGGGLIVTLKTPGGGGSSCANSIALMGVGCR